MIPLAAWPGLLLTSVVPGFFLVRAIWPAERIRDPLAFARTAILSVAFSIGITIVVGSALGYAPHGATGFFRPLWIAVGLVAASIGLFAWGLSRGAYPRLARTTARSTRPAETPAAAGRR